MPDPEHSTPKPKCLKGTEWVEESRTVSAIVPPSALSMQQCRFRLAALTLSNRVFRVEVLDFIRLL